MYFGFLPPEINSGRMYAGSGAGPMLAAASAWDNLAAELHSTAAGYSSVIAGLTSEGWMGPASTTMAAAAAPYAAWMSATAAQAEQAAAQARAAVAAYETAYAATVPPPVVATNRTQLATLVATNILGQNTPAIAANWAHYYEMWAQDATAMYGYSWASQTANELTPFTAPPQTTNPAGMSTQAATVAQSAGNAAASHAQAVTSAMPSLSAAPQAVPDVASSGAVSSASSALTPQQALSYATLVPQNGSYLFSLANSLQSLGKAFGGAAPAAAAAVGAGGLTPMLSSAVSSGSAGLGGLGGAGSAMTAGLGQSGTIGALSVPQAWAAASPVTGGMGSTLGGASLVSATSSVGANPGGLLNGAPMLANAARAAGGGGQMAAMPRFDLRPTVIPMSPAAG